MFGKLINGKLVLAPKEVIVENMEFTVTDEDGNEHTFVEDRRISNPTGEILLSLGYLPIVETDEPATEDGYRAVPHYEEQDGNIVRVWTAEKLSDPQPTTEDRIKALEEELMAAKILLGVE